MLQDEAPLFIYPHEDDSSDIGHSTQFSTNRICRMSFYNCIVLVPSVPVKARQLVKIIELIIRMFPAVKTKKQLYYIFIP